MKLFISVCCWLLSGLALYYSAMSIRFAISPPSRAPEGMRLLAVIKATGIAYSWIALFIMNYAWINNFKLGKFWPVSGTIVGVIFIGNFLITAPSMVVFVASSFFLAAYLVYFHLFASTKNQEHNKNIKEGPTG